MDSVSDSDPYSDPDREGVLLGEGFDSGRGLGLGFRGVERYLELTSRKPRRALRATVDGGGTCGVGGSGRFDGVAMKFLP